MPQSMTLKKELFLPRYAWWIMITVLLLEGCAYTIWLNRIRQSEVFLNSDGGVKLAVARQIMDGGPLATLRTPGPAWVHAWYTSAPARYPFTAPFIYDVNSDKYTCFPIWFSLITAPIDHLAGYDATFIVPLFAVWLTWFVLIWTLIRLKCPLWVIAVTVGCLVMASFLNIYTAVYSEHTLATLLAFTGVCMWVVTTKSDDKWFESGVVSACAGLLIGLSVFLRPELIGLAAALGLTTICMYPRSHSTRMLWLGLIIAALGFMASNYLLTGFIQGVHSKTTLDNPWSERVWSSINAALYVPVYAPEVVLALVCCAAVTAVGWGQAQFRGITALGIVILLTWLVTPLITPHYGGLQYGPRYYLTLSPVALLLLGMMAPTLAARMNSAALRTVVVFALVGVMGYASWRNIVIGSDFIDGTYNSRVASIKAFIDKVSPDVAIVSDSQDILFELLPTVIDRPIFTVPSLEQSQDLIAFLALNRQRYFIYIENFVTHQVTRPEQFSFVTPFGTVHAESTLLVHGWYKVYVCRIEGANDKR